MSSDLSIEHRADRVHEVLPGKLWQSGCNVRRGDLPSALDAIVAVGDAHGPREGDENWWREWIADLRRVEPGRPQRPILLHAPLIDTHRSGMLDIPAADAVARFGARMLRDGRRLLVHCDAGMFRSVLVATLVVHHFTGCGGAVALRKVRRAMGRTGGKDCIGLPEMDAMIAACKPFAATPETGGSYGCS